MNNNTKNSWESLPSSRLTVASHYIGCYAMVYSRITQKWRKERITYDLLHCTKRKGMEFSQLVTILNTRDKMTDAELKYVFGESFGPEYMERLRLNIAKSTFELWTAVGKIGNDHTLQSLHTFGYDVSRYIDNHLAVDASLSKKQWELERYIYTDERGNYSCVDVR